MKFINPVKKLKKINEERKEKSKQEIIIEIKKIYEQYAEEDKKKAREKAAQVAYEIIDNVNQGEAEELLGELGKSDKVPDEVVAKVATKIVEGEIPTNIVLNNAEENLSDEAIASILNNADMEFNHTVNLIEGITDDELRKEIILGQLEQTYEEVNQYFPHAELENRLKTLKMLEKDDEITDMIQSIVAKKIACDISHIGTTNLYVLSNIIPTGDMIKIDMPVMVQEEYDKLKEGENKGEREYNKDDFTDTILQQIAKEIGNNYDAASGVINIPMSKNMRKITNEQEKRFIEHINTEIKTNTGNVLTEFQIRAIEQKIRGKTEIKRVLEMLKDKKSAETIYELSEIIKILNGMTEKERTKAIKTYETVLQNKAKVINKQFKTPKIKGSHVHNQTINEDGPEI